LTQHCQKSFDGDSFVSQSNWQLMVIPLLANQIGRNPSMVIPLLANQDLTPVLLYYNKTAYFIVRQLKKSEIF